MASPYKHVAVRRTASFLLESLYRALKWVVHNPNDEPLWAQIRLNVGAFMQNLFRQGAFQGTSANVVSVSSRRPLARAQSAAVSISRCPMR